jgi:hypothetical protein
MRQELDKMLCEKYPKMMVNRHKDMRETTMCWGFECGDGWYNILNQLMSQIQHHIDWKQAGKEKFNQGDGCVQVTLDQVKEKFGTLRFYYTGGDDAIRGMVHLAEAMSSVTCETCGNAGKFRGKGWFYTSCDEHAKDDE